MLPGIRVLIVEDEALILAMLETDRLEIGCEVVATDCRTAKLPGFLVLPKPFVLDRPAKALGVAMGQ